MKVTGACHCGAISIEGEADPERVTICHCTDCQTGTGSAFRNSVPISGNQFKMTGVPVHYIKTTADSGRPRVQAFCGTCGTPIYSTTPGNGVQPFYTVRVGILHQRNDLPPKRQQWVRSAQPWALVPSLANHEKQAT